MVLVKKIMDKVLGGQKVKIVHDETGEVLYNGITGLDHVKDEISKARIECIYTTVDDVLIIKILN